MTNTVAGEIDIRTISLFSQSGVVNIKEHVQTLLIQESIVTPGIYAEMTILDTKNIASLLPILGGERLYIEFSALGRKPAKFDLIVTNLQESEPGENMRTKSYKLICMSYETIVNKATIVSKSYNTNVSNIVEDLLETFLKTKKKKHIQQTKGIQKIIIPSVRPFKAVKMLRNRSVSISDKSSAFVFFENQDGFHFKTIENLLSQQDYGDRDFINNPISNNDISRPIFRNILQYGQPYQFDVVDRLHAGGMNNQVQKFDYKTLEYKTITKKFDPSLFKNADGSLKNMDFSLFKEMYTNNNGKQTWVANDLGNPETFLSESKGDYMMGSSVYKQSVVSMHVFGDSELTAGQLINASIIENQSSSEAPKLNTKISGKFVIGALRHEISPSGDNPRYTCVMECFKGGYKDDVNG